MKVLYDIQTQSVKPWPRADNAPIENLDPSYVQLEVIETPQPATTTNQLASRLPDVIDLDALTLTWAWQVLDVPVVVSMRALQFALASAGLYAAVKTAACTTVEGEIWWTTSPTVRRDHPFVAQLATALGQTDEQIDAIFATAQTSTL